MKKRFGQLAVAALVCIAPLSSASAYSIYYDYAAAGDGSVRTTTETSATVYDFNSGIGSLAVSGNWQIGDGPLANTYAPPAILPSVDTTKYFVVPGTGSSGTATITFTESYNYLGLFWGSMDDYNSISFYYNDMELFTVDGIAVATPLPAGDQGSAGNNAYVNIYSDTVYWNKIVINSDGIAFELDNLAVASKVPEPATMLLFGTGIIGLAGIARRKRIDQV